jgi:hypothetical protein
MTGTAYWIAALAPLVWASAALVTVLLLTRRIWSPPRGGSGGTTATRLHSRTDRPHRAAA